jgi:NAD(P)H-quinone oxidoreductase subunit 6
MGLPLPFADLSLPPTIPFLEWRWDDLLFLILAGILLAAAFFVVIGRDIIRSGLSMILAFGALAGIYVLLGAVVVAAAQVLIYIGAISVLILFAIMLTQTKGGPLPLVFHRQWWAGALAAVGVVGLLFVSIINTDWPGKLSDRLWTATNQIALLLFSDPLYVLSIEVIGILLTAAVVGGVFLAKQERSPDPAEPAPSILERQRRPVDLAASATPVSPSAASPSAASAAQVEKP